MRGRWASAASCLAIGQALACLSAAAQPLPVKPTQLRSEAGHFVVSVTGLGRPERLNHMHGLKLSLTADGKPATGAAITLTGERRYSSTPLPTMPVVSPAPGAGHYRAAGLRFHMPGEWRLVLDIDFAHIHDRATLDVVVK